MKSGQLGPTTSRSYARRAVQVRTGPVPQGPDADNLWIIEADAAEDDDEDLDKTTAFDITGGEWEPAGTKVKRKLALLYKRLF